MASVAWGSAVAVAGLILGISSRSLALIGLGLDAAIDAGASTILVRRFAGEARDPARADHLERVAHRVIAATLLLAGAYILVSSGRALATAQKPNDSVANVTLAAAAVLVLPPLAVAKHRTALALGSRALQSDALLSGIAALLAGVALAGVLLNRLFGLARADASAAFVIGLVVAFEGTRAALHAYGRPDDPAAL